jgi:AcrR family transcriptional regulator
MTVQNDKRQALLSAAAEVIAERGTEAATTREIYSRAGVKAPTLYHHFGDKRGLMNALVDDAFDRYLAQKRAIVESGDPARDLRRGWDLHVGFARDNPIVYPLMFAAGANPPAAALESLRLLRAAFERLARDGALRRGITPKVATRTLSAALRGVAEAAAADPASRATARMSAIVRDAVIGALLAPAPH